jgi:glycosyltransferase involved in cell wall biosynthesis
MELEGPEVVILMATYNGSEYIREQLDSFVAQTHANWSLIVSDDGSTDGTLEIVCQFAKTVSQSVTIVEGPRGGFWKNFLSLIDQAGQSQGDFFAFCDQDDIWLPEKLERAVRWFEGVGQQTPGLYCARTELIDDAGNQIGFSPLFRRQPTFRNALVQSIAGGNTMVINRPTRALLAQTPKTVDLISHDWWTYRLVTGAGGRVFYDAVPSIRYRQHSSNIVGSNRGIGPRITRSVAVAGGRWKRWNDVSLAALETVERLLLPSALATIDDFSAARRSNLLNRIRLLRRSGVYRQNATETIAMYLGAILGRI